MIVNGTSSCVTALVMTWTHSMGYDSIETGRRSSVQHTVLSEQALEQVRHLIEP